MSVCLRDAVFLLCWLGSCPRGKLVIASEILVQCARGRMLLRCCATPAVAAAISASQRLTSCMHPDEGGGRERARPVKVKPKKKRPVDEWIEGIGSLWEKKGAGDPCSCC